jgi:hypothetical protein
MPRSRALLAILLAVTWCSAAWHVDLEGVGMMLEHKHQAHDDRPAEHAPLGAHDDHEEVFARDVAKDQVRVNAATVAWFAFLGFATWLIATQRIPLAELRSLRERRETNPPLVQFWQFVQRCAPESAAPPLG